MDSIADTSPRQLARLAGSIWAVRGFLLVQIAVFLVLVTIHFGLLIGGYGHPPAGATESVIVAVLLLGLLLTWTPPPWSRRAATAAQSFGTLGVLVGLLTIALGIGPRTILDLSLNVVLLLTLITGVASTKIGAEHVQAARPSACSRISDSAGWLTETWRDDGHQRVVPSRRSLAL